jgi:hypothetical protein
LAFCGEGKMYASQLAGVRRVCAVPSWRLLVLTVLRVCVCVARAPPAQFDGKDPSKPILLGAGDFVFDVSSRKASEQRFIAAAHRVLCLLGIARAAFDPVAVRGWWPSARRHTARLTGRSLAAAAGVLRPRRSLQCLRRP